MEAAGIPSDDTLRSDAHDRAFRALAHAERRRLLRLIGPGERAVGDLAASTGASQPATSQHLKVLRDAGLVDVRVDGTRRLYSVDFRRVAELKSTLDAFWTDRLAVLKEVAESPVTPGEGST